MKKKLISTLCASAMILSGGLTLSACGKDDSQAKIMNVSLNPRVEFVLDKDNKVLSVNALNEEGNLIISGNVDFVGKSANEAVNLFVTVSKENGYLVSGSYTSDKNNLEVSISGETKQIEKLYKEIKAGVESKLKELDIEGTITKAKDLTKEYLEDLVEECAPYLKEAQIQAMNYEELIKEIQKSRNETKELYSQELKEIYYQTKTEALRLAQLENVKGQMNERVQGLLKNSEDSYKSNIVAIRNLRKTHFLDENSDYQKALKWFNEKKAEYLKERKRISELPENELTDNLKQGLEDLDKAVDTAERALTRAYELAVGALDDCENLMTIAYETIVGILVGANVNMDIVSENLTQAITDFTTKFEQDYESYKTNAKKLVDDMRDQITSSNA